MRIFKLLILIISIFFSISIQSAEYQQISPLLLINDADIIIKGQIKKINTSPQSAMAMDTGTIAIEKVLKGNINTSDNIKLIFSGINRTSKTSFDITFQLNDKGIWLLRKNKNDCFRVYHPDCFQSHSTEKIIKLIIDKKNIIEISKLKNLDSKEKLLITKLYRHEGIEKDIPFLIEMLKENDEISNQANSGLYRITNQIAITKDGIQVKDKKNIINFWQIWWNANKQFSREIWIKQGIERDIDLLEDRDKKIKEQAGTRLVEFTGQYGFVGSGYAPKTEEAIGRWEFWWGENKDKTLEESAIALINSSDPYHRQKGVVMIVELIKFGNKKLYSYLVKALMDQSRMVVEHTLEGLYMLTGERFGFSSTNPPEKNVDSIKQWMLWLKKNENSVKK